MGISPPIQTASLGMADSLILMVLALVVFGPRRLPQIGRQIGKLMYEFRKASNDFKFQMEEELRNSEEADRRKRDEASRQKSLEEAQNAAALAQSAAETALNAVAEVKAAQEKAALPETETPAAAGDALEEAGEAPGLRVLPPSTGEQVAASRPGSVATRDIDTGSTEANSPPPMKIEPESEERPATEPTANHG